MFKHLKTLVSAQFQQLLAAGPLFYVDPDRDLVWQTYLQAIPETHRQSNTCSCCKSFIRQYGGIVAIQNNKLVSLWDFSINDEEYGEAVLAMRRFICSLPISGPFFAEQRKCGTDKNADGKRAGIIWEHLFIEVPQNYVRREDERGPIVAKARDDQSVLLRSINEITPDAVATVLAIREGPAALRGSRGAHSLRTTKSRRMKTPIPPELQAKLDEIIPGKNYPSYVKIVEPETAKPVDFAGTKVQGKPMTVTFNLNSFVVGLYCAMSVNGQHSHQACHTPKPFTKKFKQSVIQAIERGAEVEISGIRPLKTEF